MANTKNKIKTKRRKKEFWQTLVRKHLAQSPQEVSILAVLLALVFALFIVDGTLTGFLVREGGQLVNQTGFWITESGHGYEGNAFVSNGAGSELHYRVTGTNISLLTQRRDDYGILEVFVDGKAQLLDLYAPEPRYNVTILLAESLADGVHDVVFRVTGGRNPSSRASFVVVDGVFSRIYSPSINYKPSPPDYQSSLTNITSLSPESSLTQDTKLQPLQPSNTTGVWINVSDSLISNTNGSSLVYRFIGSHVTIVSRQRDDFGIMDVLLDGKPHAFDLWSDLEKEHNITIDAPGEGMHELSLSVSGKRNPASFGTYLVVSDVLVSSSNYPLQTTDILFPTTDLKPHYEPIQFPAEINKPVQWLQRIPVDDTLSVPLPQHNNLHVKKNGELLPDNLVLLKKGSSTFSLASMEDALPVQAALVAEQKNTENVTLLVDEGAGDYEITYETEPPHLHEKLLTPHQKEITVSSAFHYTNITTYATLPTESLEESIKLYYVVNDTKELFTRDIIYLDENQNGLVDKLQWIVPHLSNQTYLIEITVLNVFAFPRQGENWTVFFNTTGTANLTVTPVNDTLWDREISFVELKCGGENVDAVYNGLTVHKENYACNTTATFTSFVHIAGKAVLEFRFGDAVAYAYDPNQPGINVSLVNVTPYLLNESIDAAGMWNYSHTNRSIENGSVWTWLINGTEVWKETSLVGYWRFDTNYSDASGKDSHGGQNTSASHPANTSGIIKQAGSFDGTNDFISASANPPLNIQQDITLIAWVKPAVVQLGDIIAKMNASSDRGWLFELQNTGEVRFLYRAFPNGTTLFDFATNTTLVNNTWYHVAATYNGTNATIYLNGIRDASRGAVGGLGNNHDIAVEIGRLSTNNSQFFNGAIDEVRIYNRSLSAFEIANLYTMMDYGQLDTLVVQEAASRDTPAPNKPVSLWHFNENTGNTIKDAMGVNDLTTSTAAIFTSSGVYGTPAISFPDSTAPIPTNAGARNLTYNSTGGFSPRLNGITIEAWFSPGTQSMMFGQNGRIFFVGNTAGSKAYELYHSTNGSIVFAFTTADFMSSTVNVYSPEPPNGTFTHIVATYNGTMGMIYLNGTLLGQTANTNGIQPAAAASAVSIGASGNGATPVNGTIDSVAFYDHVLTAEAINQSFQRNFPHFGLDESVYGPGENVTFRLEPSDGIDFGIAVDSPLINLSQAAAPPFNNSVPNATLVNITPNPLNVSQDVAGMWNFSDANLHAENGSVWTWFVNATEVWREKALVGYWRFDNNMSDASNYGQHGRFDVESTPGLPTNREPVNVTGIIKSAYHFLGTNATVNVSSFNANESIDNIWADGGTVAFWMRLDGVGNIDGYLLQKDNSTYGWAIYQNNELCTFPPCSLFNTNLTFTHQYSTTAGVWVMDPEAIQVGVWTHIALTFNSSYAPGGWFPPTPTVYNNASFFVNGKPVMTRRKTEPSGGPLNDTSSNLFIGGDLAGTKIFNGSIDEVRMYNRTLSNDEILQLYYMMDYGQLEKAGDTAAGTPAPDRPIALWHFDDLSNKTMLDAFRQNDINGTLLGQGVGYYGTYGASFLFGNQSLGKSGIHDLNQSGNITVEVWINPRQFNNGRILSVGVANSSDYELYLANNGSAAFSMINSTGGNVVTVYTQALTSDIFTHIAATHNGSLMLIYRNGTQEGAINVSSNILQSLNPFVRVGANTSDALFLNATVDELAVYSRALTPNEVNDSALRHFPMFGLDNSTYSITANVTFQIEPFDGWGFGKTNQSQLVTVGVVAAAEAPAADTFPPGWSANITNSTRIRAGDNVLFNVTWTDDVALSTYIFSINDSGTLTNDTAKAFSGTTAVASVAKTINTARRRGDIVMWKVYANDSSNNWNETANFSFVVANTPPNATLVNLSINLTIGSDASSLWNYSDAERDLENGSVWTWLLNGTEAWYDATLVGYWRFDSNANVTNGTLHGEFNTSAETPTNGTGIIKDAFVFDGDAFVNISAKRRSPFDITNNLTIVAWIKPDALRTAQRNLSVLVSKFNTGAASAAQGGFSYALAVEDNMYLRGHVWGQTYEHNATGATVLANDTWYHVAMTYNLTNLIIYINGRPENQTITTSRDPIVDSNASVMVGNAQASKGGTQYGFNGSIDEVRIYNRSLSAFEIANLYAMMDYGQSEKNFDKAVGSSAQDIPVSLWRFNDANSMKTSVDVFGKNPVNGTVNFTTSGQYGTSAALFTGNQSMGNNGVKNLSTIGNITLEVWVNPNRAENGRIISVGLANASDYELYLAANGSAVFRMLNETNAVNVEVFTQGVGNGTFTHIAATYNGSHMRIYRNGTLEHEINATGKINNGVNRMIRIGANTSDALFYNGTIDELAVYDRALTPDEINQSFLRNFPLFGLDNSTYGANSNVTFRIEPSDGRDFGVARDSPLRTPPPTNNAPGAPPLTIPLHNETTRSRNPNFRWNASTDADGDTLTYQIQVANASTFAADSLIFNVSSLSATNYSNDTNLIPTDVAHFWRVRAFDGIEFGSFSDVFNFTIESFNSLSLPINAVGFGLMSNNDTNDTTDMLPPPFLLQNDGNVFVNITINASSLWRSSGNPTRFYQFKIRENETASFTNATATANFTNMPITSTAIDIPLFNFLNETDTAYIDINITAPSQETAGTRNSTLTITADPI